MIKHRGKIDVVFPQRILRRFRKLAKSVYPHEAYGILLGRYSPSVYHVHDIYIPDDLADYTTPYTISIPHHWWDDAQAIADSHRPKLSIIGDIHSHPSTIDASPSEIDHSRFDRCYLQAITAIWVDKRSPNKLVLRTRTKYWISGPNVVRVPS